VLLGSLVFSFGLLALILAYNHSWTDTLMRSLPIPGPRTSFAADPGLIGQMRAAKPDVRSVALADQSRAVVIETDVVNESPLPVSRVVLEATAFTGGKPVAKIASDCGKVVSDKLLSRLPPDELGVLVAIPSPNSERLEPGRAIHCQIAFPPPVPAADDFRVRVASVEPLPGHPPPRLSPWE